MEAPRVLTLIDTMKDRPFEIKETAKDFFGVLLPACTCCILSKVLDSTAPWITILDYHSERAAMWIEENLPPLFDLEIRVDSVKVKHLEMDVTLATGEFLRLLPRFSEEGIELVQSTRPLPRNLSIGALKPKSIARVFRQVGILLHFELPHPHEHAILHSPSKEFLEKVVANLRV
jgi:hypothetical protein